MLRISIDLLAFFHFNLILQLEYLDPALRKILAELSQLEPSKSALRYVEVHANLSVEVTENFLVVSGRANLALDDMVVHLVAILIVHYLSLHMKLVFAAQSFKNSA